MSGGSKKQVVGYSYFFGIHMGICRGPVDALVAAKVGDRFILQYANIDTSSVVQINEPQLFGGDKGEGGIVGPLRVMMGGPTQTAPAALEAMTGMQLPGYRRMLTVFFDGLISQMNPYPKAWKFRVRRIKKGWDGELFEEGTAEVLLSDDSDDGTSEGYGIVAMNPSHIVLECLTNREWGRGLPREALDLDSFTEAANALYAERFGLCLKWSRRDSIESFIQSVLDHAGATLFTDRTTALLTLKLIRGGYNVDDLPFFDTNNGLLEITEASISAPTKAINEVVVTYHSPTADEDRPVRAQNIAAIQAANGAINSVSKSYPGLPIASLARRVAQRDLRAASVSLRRFRLVLDRRARKIVPGDVIVIQDLQRQIPRTVVRIGRIEEESILGGRMVFTAVEDVFALPDTTFTGNQPPAWNPPNTQPCVPEHMAFELPYFMIAGSTAPADFAAIGSEAGYLGVVAEKGQPLNAGYDIAVRDSAPTPDDNADGSALCSFIP